MVFLPSSAPTLKTFNVADVVPINLAITLNAVWRYFVSYISFAITAALFAISHNHSPFGGGGSGIQWVSVASCSFMRILLFLLFPFPVRYPSALPLDLDGAAVTGRAWPAPPGHEYVVAAHVKVRIPVEIFAVTAVFVG